MARPRGHREPNLCSFCAKTEADVAKVLPGPDGVAICNECIELCNDILHPPEASRTASDVNEPATVEHQGRLTPEQALRDLKRLVDSQE